MDSSEDNTIDDVYILLHEYEQFLEDKTRETKLAYLRTIRHLIGWIMLLPGNEGCFQPQQLTKTTIEMYLTSLEEQGFSTNHCARVRSTISNFANFLIEEKGTLRRNPTRGLSVHPLPPSTPRGLSEDQRSILRALVKREKDQRGEALFALVYWAGCRVSDLSWLQMAHTHISLKGGWLHVGYKENKERDIDLVSEAYKPLYEYLQCTANPKRCYVFVSQRSERLTEEGIYYWFNTLKTHTSEQQWELIEEVTLLDLRHDFICRAKEAGCSSEELRYYLGYCTQQGMSTVQSTDRYTQVSRERIKQKLQHIKG